MAYHRTTRRKSYKDKTTGEYVEADPIFTESEAGDYLRNNRKAWTIYFDEAETWRSIPPEEFKDLFFRFNDYARDFNRQSFPPEKWYLQSIYDAKCNNLDRDADKYLDTQSLKIKGGRKSAETRAKQQQEVEGTSDPYSVSEDSDSVTLREYCKENNCDVDDALQLFAQRDGLWMPSRILTGYISEAVKKHDALYDYPIVRHHDFLLKNKGKSRDVIINGLDKAASTPPSKPQPFIRSEVKLKKACEQSNMSVKEILNTYAKAHNLWLPRDVVCSQIVEHKDVFDNYTLKDIVEYLHKTFSVNCGINADLLSDLAELKERFETICDIMEDFNEMNGYYPDIPDINTLPNNFWDEVEEPKEPDFI